MLAWQAVTTPGLGAAMHALTWLGDDWHPRVLVVMLALALVRWAGEKAALGLVVSTAGAHLVSLVIKFLVGRPRPSAAGIQIDRLRDSLSFPSGHVTTFVACFGFLFVLALLRMRRGALRGGVLAVLGLFLVGIGPSRVWLGEHWPSDVLGGYLTGVCWLGLFVPGFVAWARTANPGSASERVPG
jgi:undecaprenyl-diphosphatase